MSSVGIFEVSPGNVPVYHGSDLKAVDRKVRITELVLRCVIFGWGVLAAALVGFDVQKIDVELNEVGRQQAAAVADRLSKEPKISAVYSSDLKRAFITAQTIANSCGVLEVIQDPDLRERHLGDLQGLVLREAAKLKPEAYQAIVSGRADKDIPGGGESLEQLYQRCTSSLQKIGRKHKGERVVVVTHGGVVRSLYRRASPKGKPQGKILNTSVNIFHLSDGEDWAIKVWGDVSHLSKTGFLETAFGGDRTSG